MRAPCCPPSDLWQIAIWAFIEWFNIIQMNFVRANQFDGFFFEVVTPQQRARRRESSNTM
jgi:hypothetical protein